MLLLAGWSAFASSFLYAYIKGDSTIELKGLTIKAAADSEHVSQDNKCAFVLEPVEHCSWFCEVFWSVLIVLTCCHDKFKQTILLCLYTS